MGIFKQNKEKAKALEEEKKHQEETLKSPAPVEDVSIDTSKEETKKELTLRDMCNDYPDSWFKEQVLTLLSEVVQRLREEKVGDKDEDSRK